MAERILFLHMDDLNKIHVVSSTLSSNDVRGRLEPMMNFEWMNEHCWLRTMLNSYTLPSHREYEEAEVV